MCVFTRCYILCLASLWLICPESAHGIALSTSSLKVADEASTTEVTTKSSGKKKRKSGSPYKYEVQPGDTLGGVGKRFGVSVKELRKWNKLRSDVIYVGRTLKVYPKKPIRVVREREVPVKKGDTLGGIAKENGVTVEQLMTWNKLRNPRQLRAGKSLKILKKGPENPSEAKGRPQAGRLINGEQMPLDHDCYVLKRKRNAWGTNETVEQLLQAVQAVCRSKKLKRKTRRKKIPPIVIGDISSRKGGFLPPHKSHQNGRDVDMGYYHKGNKRLKDFKSATEKNLDMTLTWALIEQLLDQDAVEYLFMDRKIQKLMYAWALENGEKESRLRKLFQHPRGKGKPVIRHEPGHVNHIHIRFRCPSTDESCR